jgi:hypothetical protein
MSKQVVIDFDKAKCNLFGHVVGFSAAQAELIVMDGPNYPSDDISLGDTNLTVKVKANVPEGVSHTQLMGQCMLELKHSECFVVCNGKEYPAKHIYVEYEEGSLSINFYGNRNRPVDAQLSQAQQVEK